VILLTVGTQLPFDRLVRAVDAWCAASGRRDVFGQVGPIQQDSYRPTNFEYKTFVPPGDLDRLFSTADLVVAHAGMGSIISALQYARPIVVMPRRLSLGEHRNDHQLATAAKFRNRSGVYVASDENALPIKLEEAQAGDRNPLQSLPDTAQPQLLNAVREFILRENVSIERQD
jgi:UDP-N-acetylglucosamine transferase subunit ALG13